MSDTKRLGRAEIGVSTLPWLLALRDALFWPAVIGTAGRAKGLGGPCAPALNIALADGEGAGRTTAEWPGSELPLAGVATVLPESLGDVELAVTLVSDCSLGICKLSCGRRLLLRDDGTDDSDWVRCGCDCCDWGSGRTLPLTGSGWEREWGGGAGTVFAGSSGVSASDLSGVSAFGDSAVGPKPNCLARMDLRSSIGVYIPRH